MVRYCTMGQHRDYYVHDWLIDSFIHLTLYVSLRLWRTRGAVAPLVWKASSSGKDLCRYKGWWGLRPWILCARVHDGISQLQGLNSFAVLSRRVHCLNENTYTFRLCRRAQPHVSLWLRSGSVQQERSASHTSPQAIRSIRQSKGPLQRSVTVLG
jgi:hypothetical protein